MQTPWATSGLAILLASLLALCCSSGCSTADVTATSLSVASSTAATFSASLAVADVDTLDIDTKKGASFTAATTFYWRYPRGSRTGHDELDIASCNYTMPACLCERIAMLWVCEKSRSLSQCTEKYPPSLFCEAGEEAGPPATTYTTTTGPYTWEPITTAWEYISTATGPPPKKTKGCVMDGLPPDDCETRVGHMPNELAERTGPGLSVPTTFATATSAAKG